MNIYWGDIHNHCGITYGFGSLENALAAAKGQLDFCGVTGHAMWPDIPERTEKLSFLVDFHKKGFSKLKDRWEQVRNTIKEANRPYEFVTFQGYEIHSREYGDYHIVSVDDKLPLKYEDSPLQLIEKLKPAIIIPHHIAYTPGYRGINWDVFSSLHSPVVEVFSKHGCGMSDMSLYPYLHTMGPRDSRNTAYTGLQKGCRFGFAASTDHHAGYPGSYGDGRMAVLAKEKTREAIWEAILNRRTYAVTGDKIQCCFHINNWPMGSEIKSSDVRNVSLDIIACDYIDKVVIYKNIRPWKIINGNYSLVSHAVPGEYKIRIEMGWGASNFQFDWKGSILVEEGNVLSVETCFRGKSILSPTAEMKDEPDINKLNNRLIECTSSSAAWECTTFKNPTTLHSQTDSVIVKIQGDSSTALKIKINNKETYHTLKELLAGNYSYHMDEYNSEAFLIHRAVPMSRYANSYECEDKEKENECDVYHVEVRQVNSQMAWVSPIYVLS